MRISMLNGKDYSGENVLVDPFNPELGSKVIVLFEKDHDNIRIPMIDMNINLKNTTEYCPRHPLSKILYKTTSETVKFSKFLENLKNKNDFNLISKTRVINRVINHQKTIIYDSVNPNTEKGSQILEQITMNFLDGTGYFLIDPNSRVCLESTKISYKNTYKISLAYEIKTNRGKGSESIIQSLEAKLKR